MMERNENHDRNCCRPIVELGRQMPDLTVMVPKFSAITLAI
jgi:hypothetical protein